MFSKETIANRHCSERYNAVSFLDVLFRCLLVQTLCLAKILSISIFLDFTVALFADQKRLFTVMTSAVPVGGSFGEAKGV
jgi:hypothetical protein